MATSTNEITGDSNGQAPQATGEGSGDIVVIVDGTSTTQASRASGASSGLVSTNSTSFSVEYRKTNSNTLGVVFDASRTQYISVDTGIPATGDFTLELWVDIPADASDDVVLYSTESLDGSQTILYGSTNTGTATNQLRYWNSTLGELFVGTDLRGAGPTRIAIMRTGTNHYLLYNGALFKSTVNSGADNLHSPDITWIGGDTSQPLSRMEGVIYHCRVWDKTRSSAEMDADASLSLTGTEEGLVACWNMQEGSGLTTVDAVSGVNDSLQNDAWQSLGPGETTTIVDINDLFLDVTGLSTNTGYEWRVQEDDGTQQSDWSSWTTFTTTAASITGESSSQASQASHQASESLATYSADVFISIGQEDLSPVVIEAASHVNAAQATFLTSATRIVSGTSESFAMTASHEASTGVSPVLEGSGSGQASQALHDALGQREVSSTSEGLTRGATHTSSGVRGIVGASEGLSVRSNQTSTGIRKLVGSSTVGASQTLHTSSGARVLTGLLEGVASRAYSSALGLRELLAASNSIAIRSTQDSSGSREAVSTSVGVAGQVDHNSQGVRGVTGGAMNEATNATHEATSALSRSRTGQSDVIALRANSEASGSRELVATSEAVPSPSVQVSEGSRGVVGEMDTQAAGATHEAVSVVYSNIEGESSSFSLPAYHAASGFRRVVSNSSTLAYQAACEGVGEIGRVGSSAIQTAQATQEAQGLRQITSSSDVFSIRATHEATSETSKNIGGVSDVAALRATQVSTGERTVSGTSESVATMVEHSVLGTREVVAESVSQVSPVVHSGLAIREVGGHSSVTAARVIHTATSEVSGNVSGTSEATSGQASQESAGTREVVLGSSVQASQATSEALGEVSVGIVGTSSPTASQALHTASAERSVVGASDSLAQRASHTASANATGNVEGTSSVQASRATQTATSASFRTLVGDSSTQASQASQESSGYREIVGLTYTQAYQANAEASGSRKVVGNSDAGTARASSSLIGKIIKTAQSAVTASRTTQTSNGGITQHITGSSDARAQRATQFSTSRPTFVGPFVDTSIEIVPTYYSFEVTRENYGLRVLTDRHSVKVEGTSYRLNLITDKYNVEVV